MDTFSCIAARKSVRDFSDKPLGDAEIKKLIEAALYAPVGMKAYDSLHLTCVTDEKALAAIRGMARKKTGDENADPLHGAPALIVVSVKELTHVAFANSACMIENMLLEAAELGLGSLYVCGIVNALREDAEFLALLRIPAGFTPVGAAAAGYAKEGAPAPAPCRNKVTKIDYIR